MVRKEICLNKWEQTNTVLSIVANRKAVDGDYKVKVSLDVEGIKSEQEISVKVGQDKSIKMEFLETQANANIGRDYLTVKLTNETNGTKTGFSCR